MNAPRRLAQITALLIAAALAAALAVTALSLPAEPAPLAATALSRLPESGVTNPVTAVLLNYRAYDTLLEIAVLLLALLGTWSLRALSPIRPHRAPGPVLAAVVHLLVPVMILAAAYLLWAGTSRPGGAFQGGAILAAAAVLLMLANVHLLPGPGSRWFRGSVIVGFAIFLAVGVAMIALGRIFLQYPPDQAGMLILLIEAAATLTIGTVLAAIFAGNPEEIERLSHPAPDDEESP